jgi:hypothetical protein
MKGVKCIAEIYEVTCNRCGITNKVYVELQEPVPAGIEKEGCKNSPIDITTATVDCPSQRCHGKFDFVGKTAYLLNKDIFEGKMVRLHELLKEMDEICKG